MGKGKILLVDDEPDVIEFLKYNLEKEGFEIATAQNGLEALEVMETFTPSLVMLDVMMAKLDGVETCLKIRENPNFNNVVICMLTARNEDYTQIAAYKSGADDFITKPIKPRLLISKVNSLLRRSNGRVKTSTSVKVGNIEVDVDRFLVTQEGKNYTLPKKEFELLVLLTSIPERVFTRQEIYRKIWGGDLIIGDRTIDVHIRKLREKFGEKYIQTIKGIGYKFNV